MINFLKTFTVIHNFRQKRWAGVLINLIGLIGIIAVLFLIRRLAFVDPETAVGVAFVFGLVLAVPCSFSFSFKIRDPLEKTDGKEE